MMAIPNMIHSRMSWGMMMLSTKCIVRPTPTHNLRALYAAVFILGNRPDIRPTKEKHLIKNFSTS